MDVKRLVGSGDRIMLFVLPLLVIGVILNVVFPSFFSVGGPPGWLWGVSVVGLIAGAAIWLWSVVLILAKVPKGELITTGPFHFVKHPLYTGVSLLLIPSLGFLLDSWLGVVLGAAMYVAARRYAPAEEAELSEAFGPAWDSYVRTVKFSRL